MQLANGSGSFTGNYWNKGMNKRFAFIVGLLVAVLCLWTACKDDSPSTGESILNESDKIIVLADTFDIRSAIDDCPSIISQPDSLLLGEIETDYGLLHASILTQLACPEGYSYPEGFEVDSVCLFMYYGSWSGDDNAPLAINAYMMDRKTFAYSTSYRTDLNIDDYCSRDSSILTNHRIVAASEKRDSIQNSSGTYIPMIRMRVNDDFMQYFSNITSFKDQESFNEQFKGLLIETSFGSSTILHISDIALGVFYHFSYSKAGNDTTVSDMKAFYANSEVRTINHLQYRDKKDWIEALEKDSDTYNYIIAPAGVYTRLRFPIRKMTDSIFHQMEDPVTGDTIKRPYVNKAAVRVAVENVSGSSTSNLTRNDWLQPATYMLLIKEESMERFFKKHELPTDTCALLGTLTQGVDSAGNNIYYYSYDMSDFIANGLHKILNGESSETIAEELNMLLVPVTIETSTTSYSTSAVSSVRQQQTLSATKIRSAKNGMSLEMVYCGF